jgi:hypothetical protein
MSTEFSEIHMGQRLEAFVRGAKHGSGLNAFEKFSGRAKSSITGLYKAKSLDLDLIVKACDYFDLTLAEFLGIKAEELPSVLTSAQSSKDLIERKVNRIDKNVTEILTLLDKSIKN